MMRIKTGEQMVFIGETVWGMLGYRVKTERLKTGFWRCQKRNFIVNGQRRFDNG